jgi:hypothetical protein
MADSDPFVDPLGDFSKDCLEEQEQVGFVCNACRRYFTEEPFIKVEKLCRDCGTEYALSLFEKHGAA